ncbi:MAG: helix-turn-helix transcriptional regulator [Spongiibacteraceae bacterium]|nr:helix-turn-helix transcriptional regulator [Spongiibacteraceae bacterium]
MNTSQTSYSAVLGVVLSNQRQLQRMEQGDMAARMGLSQASYSRLEAGKSAFSIDQMYQAALALGVSGELLTSNLNNTVANLRANSVEVVSQVRGNTTQAKKEGLDMGTLVTGAALGALLIGILSKK